VDAELVTLASSGASTLVTLMVTDGWHDLKAKVAGLLRRERADPSAVDEQLERSRAELFAARERDDLGALADIEAEWRLRLKRLLQDDQGAAPELAALVAQLAPNVEQAGAHTEIHHNVFQGPAPVNSGSGDQHNTFGG
jgi:hypothetical protein